MEKHSDNIFFSAPPELQEKIESLKENRYPNVPEEEMLKDLVRYGLAFLEQYPETDDPFTVQWKTILSSYIFV